MWVISPLSLSLDSTADRSERSTAIYVAWLRNSGLLRDSPMTSQSPSETKWLTRVRPVTPSAPATKAFFMGRESHTKATKARRWNRNSRKRTQSRRKKLTQGRKGAKVNAEGRIGHRRSQRPQRGSTADGVRR